MNALTKHVSADSQLTVAEAKGLTERIRHAVQQTWKLLLEAKEREAWRVLGYPSFTAYVEKEFNFRKSHAYRLLDHGRVVKQLAAAAGVSPIGENLDINEHTARTIKPHLLEVVADVQERVDRGDDPVDAVQTVVQDVVEKKRRAYAVARKRNGGDPNRRVEVIASQMAELAEALGYCDSVGDLDVECFGAWSRDLQAGALAVLALSHKLLCERARLDTSARDALPMILANDIVIVIEDAVKDLRGPAKSDVLALLRQRFWGAS